MSCEMNNKRVMLIFDPKAKTITGGLSMPRYAARVSQVRSHGIFNSMTVWLIQLYASRRLKDMDKIDVAAEWDKLDLRVSWLFMIVHEIWDGLRDIADCSLDTSAVTLHDYSSLCNVHQQSFCKLLSGFKRCGDVSRTEQLSMRRHSESYSYLMVVTMIAEVSSV